MDEQNYENGQNGGDSNNSQQGNYYQDYTANMQQYQAPPQNDGPRGANGLQVAGLVLGIIGIPASCCYGIGLVFGFIGLILSLVGNKRNKGSGIGLGGLICSIIAVVLGMIMVIYFVYTFTVLMNSGTFEEMMQQFMGNYYNYY